MSRRYLQQRTEPEQPPDDGPRCCPCSADLGRGGELAEGPHYGARPWTRWT
jgi:hypothetical protein